MDITSWQTFCLSQLEKYKWAWGKEDVCNKCERLIQAQAALVLYQMFSAQVTVETAAQALRDTPRSCGHRHIPTYTLIYSAMTAAAGMPAGETYDAHSKHFTHVYLSLSSFAFLVGMDAKRTGMLLDLTMQVVAIAGSVHLKMITAPGPTGTMLHSLATVYKKYTECMAYTGVARTECLILRWVSLPLIALQLKLEYKPQDVDDIRMHLKSRASIGYPPKCIATEQEMDTLSQVLYAASRRWRL